MQRRITGTVNIRFVNRIKQDIPQVCRFLSVKPVSQDVLGSAVLGFFLSSTAMRHDM
jgi:hypothetical protein